MYVKADKRLCVCLRVEWEEAQSLFSILVIS